MDWKGFFKFSRQKLISVVCLFVFSFIVYFALIFVVMGELGNIFTIGIIFLYKVLTPFLTISIIPKVGIFLNLIYYYLITCIFLYSKNHPKDRKLFTFVLILIIILSISGSYFVWDSAYFEVVKENLLGNSLSGASEIPLE